MKIALYGFGAYPVFFKEAIKASKGMEWLAIAPTYHFRDEFARLLGRENVFYLQERLNSLMAGGKADMAKLSGFHGSIYRDMAIDKGDSAGDEGQLRKRPKEYQLRNACFTYAAYRGFLEKAKPDLVLFPIIETYDAIILYDACKELGIETAICTGARNFGGSFFSQSFTEELPGYAFSDIDKASRQKATEFVKEFRKEFKPPEYRMYEPKPDEVISWSSTPFLKRAWRYLQSALTNEEPHYISQNTLLLRLKVNLFPLLMAIRSVEAALARRHFDIRSINEVPERFVYYPLQVTPESSINTLAPYFVDQLRAIDMILYNMPSDCMLVVKEHPAMLGLRPDSFYKELKHKPGVVLADPSIPSIELVKRAALTVSVTGTACLEAFLMARPSMHLGMTFFTRWISHGDSADMKDTITKAMAAKVSDESVYDLVARMFMVSRDFVLYDPSGKYLESRYVMNRRNVAKFLEALGEHVEKVKAGRS